ncbi:Pheromone B beta 1 receptor [Ceratobasidium theobromae]|uniref:Pheromone B beta 1 receptor n=1 Tax=Ceratobasidium theobromae TaxID=1582974 RepID=A0A5N5QFK0_9AGAM|nr:Pheromone B beta 1 receptor [Ceratobasidium theobromae]
MRIELPIVSFICTILVLIPLPYHWRTRNVATLSIIAWLVICNVIRGVNAVIWGGSTVVKYKIWCDINTKLIVGAQIALASSVCCVCRYLSQVASPHHSIQEPSRKRRRMILELVMCVGLPMITMALHYVVQGHRFDILEDFGCAPTVYMSVAGLFIIYIPPLVISLAGLVYAGISLCWFIYRRAQLHAILQSSQPGLTTSRYLRFIILSAIQMFYATTLTLFVLLANITQGGLRPWVSWDFVHSDWQRINQIARVVAPQSFWDIYIVTWYIVPFSSLLFFAFYGLGQEVKSEYIKLFSRIFRTKPKSGSALPVSFIRLPIISSPAVTRQTETEISAQDKWSDFPSSTIYHGSRPSSPSDKKVKRVLDPQVC